MPLTRYDSHLNIKYFNFHYFSLRIHLRQRLIINLSNCHFLYSEMTSIVGGIDRQKVEFPCFSSQPVTKLRGSKPYL